MSAPLTKKELIEKAMEEYNGKKMSFVDLLAKVDAKVKKRFTKYGERK